MNSKEKEKLFEFGDKDLVLFKSNRKNSSIVLAGLIKILALMKIKPPLDINIHIKKSDDKSTTDFCLLLNKLLWCCKLLFNPKSMLQALFIGIGFVSQNIEFINFRCFFKIMIRNNSFYSSVMNHIYIFIITLKFNIHIIN